MREIKFRVWDKKEKKIIYGYDAYNGFDECVAYDDYILLQYTGLKDEKGIEIYEGDIVKSNDKYYPINEVIYVSEVINEHDGDWQEWYCGFCLDNVDNTPLSEDVEIIGNIYENPKLLK